MKNTKQTAKNRAAVIRRVIACLVVLTMCVSWLPVYNTVRAETTGWAANTSAPANGAGTEASPYEITTGAELAYVLLEKTSAHAKLMNDVDLSQYAWISKSFSGVLDGNGKMITGLYLGSSNSPYPAPAPATSTAYVYVGGLINKLSGTVKNLAVEVSLYVDGTLCTGGLYFGGLAAQSTGTIDNCTITGTIDVTTPSYTLIAGGLVGDLGNAKITNCVNRANMRCEHTTTSNNKNMRVGGIAGHINAAGAAISNCANLGNITVKTARTGAENSAVTGICVIKQTATISNCYNAGVLTNQGSTNRFDIYSGANGTQVSCYYWDSAASQYAKSGDTDVTYADNAALMAALNANVTAAGTDSGWLTWVADKNGYPVPGADLIPLRLSGTVTIAGESVYGQTLTAAVDNANATDLTYQWRRNSVAIDGANGLTYTLTEADIGCAIEFLVTSATFQGALKASAGTVAKLTGPDAPTVTGQDATSAAANDGKLLGTTAAMEYSKSVDFAQAFDCADNETTGLAPGIYYVRVKATATVAAGKAVQITILDASAPQLGYWTDDGNYTAGDLTGDGSETAPYQINSAADLAKLAKIFNTVDASQGKYFKITVDEIDLSAHEWVPITNFAGVLDGNNALIKGLWIGTELQPRDYENAGLFGMISAGAVVKNLRVTGDIRISSTSASTNAGMIVGQLSGTVDRCVTNGVLHVDSTGTPSAGGVAGRVTVSTDNVLLTNCGSAVNVYANSSTSAEAFAGGILGWVDNRPADTANVKTVKILNCYNTGNVSSGVEDDNDSTTTARRARAGGIAGWLRGLTADVVSVTLQNCYNTGTVTVHASDADAKGTLDGIVGAAQSAFKHFANCFSLDGAAAANAHATLDKKISGEKMSLEDMQAVDFAVNLTINANSLVADETGSGLYEWVPVVDGTPTFGTKTVTGRAVGLNVNVNSNRLGSVKVEVNAGGSASYVQIGNAALVEKGDSVRVTLLPTAGCAVNSLKANGVPVTVDNNVYTFTIQEATTIDVEYQVVSTTDVDPIYVDCDAAAGGNGTKESPFKTLEEARAKIRSVLAATPTANLTVYLMGGTYVLDETFSLGAEESSLGRLTFKNYNNENVVITSAHAVSGEWTKVSGKNYYSYQLPGSGNWPAFRDLLVNGERATLAKSKEYAYKLNWVNAVYKENSNIGSCDNLLYISSDALSGITNENLNGVEIGQLMEWKSQIFHIASLTGESSKGELQITLDSTEFYNLLNTDSTMKDLTGRTYWLQNHINFLDEPGEFYYDQSAGVVYYYPLSNVDISEAEIAYATLDYLVELENTANITFDGITFTGTTANDITENGLITHLGNTIREPIGAGTDAGRNVPYAAIHGISNVEGVEVLNCRFTDLGGSAMVFDFGIKDLTVVGNVMKDLAMAGIQVGRNQRAWNQGGELGASEDVTISNNYITNIGLVVYGAPGIRVARSKNLTIQHNTIVHVPYSAIMAGYGWNLNPTQAENTCLINADISYNYVEDYLFKINDGGAIYTCGANDFVENTELFNEIHHNYVRSGAHNKTYTGIYHDGSASNWLTHHNVIDDLQSTLGPMFFQDVVANQNTHNITAANNYTSVSLISTSAKADRNIVLKDNVKVADRAELLAIPEAAAIMAGAGLEEAYAHIAEPMDTALQIQDNTMHYQVSDEQTENTTASVKLTNNSDTTKTFTLSVAEALPSFVTVTFKGNNVQLKPGESAVVTMEFVVDKENFVRADGLVLGFVVTDSNGVTTDFPRQFTFSANKLAGNQIAYGTPNIDGILDEAYHESSRVLFNTEPYNVSGVDGATSIDGYAYMLWDETYLYFYAYVEDATVKSRGIDYVTEMYANGTGNPNNLWRTDGVEAYIASTHRVGSLTKFAVDAFGLQPFTNSNVKFSVVDALPYATRFVDSGTVLDQSFNIERPTAGQLASTSHRVVTGYVIEMTLPLTTCVDLQEEGKPQAGDMIDFYLQVNDYTLDYQDANGATAPNVVSSKTATEKFVLLGEKCKECVDANKDHKCDVCGKELSTCADADKDHKCDLCGKELSTCTDADKNNKCDICGTDVSGDPVPDTGDHTLVLAAGFMCVLAALFIAALVITNGSGKKYTRK